jgi:hypothetical protein
MKKYKFEALLKTSNGEVYMKAWRSPDGIIDCVCTNHIGSWSKEFYDRKDVWNYLHNVLDVKNVIKMMEMF